MPEPTIRKRAYRPWIKGSTFELKIDGKTYDYRTGKTDLTGTQRTVSEGHQVSKLGHTDEDIGGDFHSYKSEIVHVSHPNVKIDTGGAVQRIYTGPILPAGTRTLGEHEVNLTSDFNLRAKGATAISRTSPVDSRAEALTSISETLKDGLPAMAGVSTWRDRTQISKGAGSEYLNAQFGWVPLISDVRAVADSYKKSAKILEQLQRDAGRRVRRRYEFPVERETTVVRHITSNGGAQLQSGNAVALDGSYWSNHNGSLVQTRTIKRKTWFAGAFTYHMPAGKTQMDKVLRAYQMSDHLYGTGLTPDVLWNLTPWSWATDWFANTGDVLANISNAMLYGQVLPYAYVMEKTTILDEHRTEAPGFILGSSAYTATVKTTVQRRIRATPFGFGLTYDGLDAYQLSIMAALGLTRR